MTLRRSASPSPLRRLLAAGAAALVLLLAVFAASPDLHALLHAGEIDADDHCAVALFSGGVAPHFAAIVAPLPPLASSAAAFASRTEISVPAPRYRLLPGRGPPAC